jgi:DNA polymerase-3 subunit gamma/tau
MGKALYRTYRSKSFDELVGQEHITTTLKNAVKKGAISHAYLFTGPRGVGKTSVARILAHEINDLPYSDDSTHLDIIEIDAASNRRIDEIRDLREKVHIAPTSAKYKVYIIDEVHMLTREAFNALLKTLEEPPKHVVFILATTEVHKLPDTIVSRTQHFAFKPIAPKQAVEHLQSIAKNENIEITVEALERIAEHGRGSFRDSISMLDQLKNLDKNISLEDVDLLLGLPPKMLVSNLLTAVASDNPANVLNIIDEIKVLGIDISVIAKAVSDDLHQILADQNNAIMTPGKALLVLEKLLPLTVGSTTPLHLEVALLTSLNFNNTPATPTKTTAQVTENISEQKSQSIEPTKEEPKSEVNIEETTMASNTINTGNLWPDILQIIKGNYNTLYGILRMAKATYDEDNLKLMFRFPFHKKQVDQAKNIEILRETAKLITGSPVIITTVIDTSLTDEHVDKPEPAKVQKTEDNTALKDISNIFEGAELLEL